MHAVFVVVLFCFSIQNCDFGTRIASLYGSQPSSAVLCIHNSDNMTRNTSLCVSQTSPMVFCVQTCDFGTRIASLYGSQPSSAVLCIHNSDIMNRNTSLHGSKTSFEAFASTTAKLGPELQVSIVPDFTC